MVLGFLSGIFEGIGVNALIPLLSFLIPGSGAAPADHISHFIASLFGFFGIGFIFRNLIFFIFSLFMLRTVIVVASSYIRGAVMTDITNSETRSLVKLLLAARWSFLLRQKIGYVQNTLIRDIQRSTGLFEAAAQVIQSFTGFLMYFAVALNISAPVTLAAVAAGGSFAVVLRPIGRKLQIASSAAANEEKAVAQFVSESIIGMKVVKISGREREIVEHGSRLLELLQHLYRKAVLYKSISSAVIQPFSLVFVLSVLWFMYRSPGFNLAAFAVIIYLIQKIFAYLDSTQAGFQGVLELIPYAENVLEFKRTLIHEAERDHHEAGSQSFSFRQTLEFKNVVFGYSHDRTVLSNISFAIRRGETIGIIGPSGAGKTSVADLILRLFTPSSGNIALDGISIEGINLQSWRQHIAYVPQDVFLFNGSIEDNIKFYRDDLSEKEIADAARAANIYDYIASLPEGFTTIVGDRGVMLSGGQRQRVALARALVHLPDILILDEATSALDHESETLIHQSIEALRSKVTVIMIAHRLSTVMSADRIFVLDNGTIAESGAPQDLLADTSSYLHKNYHG